MRLTRSYIGNRRRGRRLDDRNPIDARTAQAAPDKIAWMRLPNTIVARKIYLAAHIAKLLDLPQRLTEGCRGALTHALGEWGAHDEEGKSSSESVFVLAGVASLEPRRRRRELSTVGGHRGSN